MNLTAADPDQRSTIIWISPASLLAHSNLLIGHFIMNDTTDAKGTQSANNLKILYYVSLFWSREQQRLPHNHSHHTFRVLRGARKRSPRLGKSTNPRITVHGRQHQARLLVLCINDSSPTEFTTFKEFQRTFRGDIVYGVFSSIHIQLVETNHHKPSRWFLRNLEKTCWSMRPMGNR